MSVYVVNAYNIDDPKLYQDYPPHVRRLLGKYGGRVLAMQTNPKALEGIPRTMNVIIEFPSEAEVFGFYKDPEYQKVIHLRHDSTSDCTMIILPEFKRD